MGAVTGGGGTGGCVPLFEILGGRPPKITTFEENFTSKYQNI